MDSIGGVGVLDKIMILIESVQAQGGATLSELVDASGIPRATAHRLATALEEHGLLRRDETGRYRLGIALVALGQAAGKDFPLATRARPVLEDLQRATSESVQFYVREGAHRRCLISLEATHGLRWIVPEGKRMPLEKGSAGRVLAGAKVGSNGWIESVEEREVGVASVSAPVIGELGKVIGAVCVSGPLERLSRQPGRKYGKQVVATAHKLEAAINL